MDFYMEQRLSNLKMSNKEDPDTFMKEKYKNDCYEHRVNLDDRYKCYMNMDSTKRRITHHNIKEKGLPFKNLT